MKICRWILALALILVALPILAQKTVHVSGYTRSDGTYVAPHTRSAPGTTSSTSTPSTTTRVSTSTPTTRFSGSTSTVERDSHGRIKRSEAAKHQFMRQTGYPNGRSGYVIDHVIPLARGGADNPSNMQWQTVADAKAKDKVELRPGYVATATRPVRYSGDVSTTFIVPVVYADASTGVYFREDCTHPQSAVKMKKSAALTQGYRPSPECFGRR